jgi:transcriptional regulator with XRE-family HTH domain
MSIGERIRERRDELGLTQEYLAQTLSLTSQYISAIENNLRAPSLDSLEGLAQQLGVTIDYLVSGKDGVIVNTITAIRADKKLSLKSKKALVSLVEELYSDSTTDKK